MTPKQRKFIEFYMQCDNATEAARRAGYSEKNARRIGSENLTKLDIQTEIAARQTALLAAEGITGDWVLLQLARTAKASILDAVDLVEITDINGEETGEQAVHLDMEALRSIKVSVAGIKNTRDGIEVKMRDSLRALELLGQHFKLFKQQGNGSADESKKASNLFDVIRESAVAMEDDDAI